MSINTCVSMGNVRYYADSERLHYSESIWLPRWSSWHKPLWVQIRQSEDCVLPFHKCDQTAPREREHTSYFECTQTFVDTQSRMLELSSQLWTIGSRDRVKRDLTGVVDKLIRGWDNEIENETQSFDHSLGIIRLANHFCYITQLQDFVAIHQDSCRRPMSFQINISNIFSISDIVNRVYSLWIKARKSSHQQKI